MAVVHGGSNDLAKTTIAPHKLAEHVLSKAEKLTCELGVEEVVVLTCLPRQDGIRGSPTQFETRRKVYNSKLRSLGKELNNITEDTARV